MIKTISDKLIVFSNIIKNCLTLSILVVPLYDKKSLSLIFEMTSIMVILNNLVQANFDLLEWMDFSATKSFSHMGV